MSVRKGRVLIVDDSTAVRAAIERMISADPELEVCGKAIDGRDALRQAEALRPDLVTLDVEMPGMDGLSALRALKKLDPSRPVVMLSSLTERGAEATLDALAEGADDYMPKPVAAGGFDLMAKALPALIKALCEKSCSVGGGATPKPSAIVGGSTASTPSRVRHLKPRVIVAAASTGGPDALKRFLAELPRSFDVPIVAAVHMPPEFTRALSARLAACSGKDVKEAVEGESLEGGVVRIAPGSRHVVVASAVGVVRTHLDDGPAENACKPSADPLFRSAAAEFGRRTLAIVFTGMGVDGCAGVRAIVAAGGAAWAQDRHSSVVWGMPGAVCDAGLAERVGNPSELAFQADRLARQVATPAKARV